MNKIPSILVDTGFPVDQNGALTEIVMPAVVSTLNAPRKVTFLGQTLNWTPSTNAALEELYAPNVQSITGTVLQSFSNITTLSMPGLKAITFSGISSSAMFLDYASLTSINLPSLQAATVDSSGSAYIFRNVNSLTSVSLPSLQTLSIFNRYNDEGGFIHSYSLTSLELPELTAIANSGTGRVFNCSGLITASLPKLSTCAGRAFAGCTALQSVTLGSTGHPVTSLVTGTFNGCTQSGLTITIYTQGGAALAGEPWGATNATIEYEEA